MPSDREMAVIAWLFIGLLACLFREDTRASIIALGRAALAPRLLVPCLLFASYIALAAWQANSVGLWQPSLASDTVAWFIGPGLGMVFGAVQVSTGTRTFGHLAVSALKLTALVEVYLNLYDFGFLLEFLVVIPFVTGLVALSVVAKSDSSTQPTGRCFEGVLGVLGFILLLVVLIRLVGDRAILDPTDLLQTFLLPIWLSIAALPVVGIMSAVFGYWEAVGSTKHLDHRRWDRTRLLVALVTEFRLDLGDLHRFRLPWTKRALNATSLGDTRSIAREYLEHRQADRSAAAAAEDRLERMAGVEGTDDQGRQLDQREFRETKEALQTLWVAQIGWHRRDGRFREDLVSMFESSFVSRGLPDPSGVTMEVAADGQAWFAWRRTVTGWCLAIGMAEGPTDDKPPVEWLYAGPEPPNGYPERDPAWGEPWGTEFPDW